MLYHKIALASSFALAVALSATPAVAQQVPAGTPADEDAPDDDLHSRQVGETGEIVVSAQGVRELDILAGTSVLEGVELQRELDGQLGEVLDKLPGVTATSFTPGASRPILRGFSGERVRVLIDGIGTIDASNTSDDHAVSVDPLTVEQDRGAARTSGAAVWQPGDRRRGQRHRQAHPAARAGRADPC
jgi:iron complex outermembrane receptor protein